MSRVETEMNNLRVSLEKGLESSETESMMDVLKALEQLPISIALLKSTKIGNTLQDVKKKFAESEVGTNARNLITKWKKDCEAQLPPKTPKSEANGSKEGSVASSTASLVRTPSTEIEDDAADELYDQLTPIRKTIMEMFTQCFKLNANGAVSRFLAFNVESSMDKLHSSLKDQKLYMNKAKSLAFNLKKNEKLRLEVINGSLPPDQLPHLSSNELATDELRGIRQETSKNATLARRGDLYEITRNEILSANGIDPNKGGEFCCRKCKGTKTTHYALQTRSSDEPMTVFVGCLTCGNRWRCT